MAGEAFADCFEESRLSLSWSASYKDILRFCKINDLYLVVKRDTDSEGNVRFAILKGFALP